LILLVDYCSLLSKSQQYVCISVDLSTAIAFHQLKCGLKRDCWGERFLFLRWSVKIIGKLCHKCFNSCKHAVSCFGLAILILISKKHYCKLGFCNFIQFLFNGLLFFSCSPLWSPFPRRMFKSKWNMILCDQYRYFPVAELKVLKHRRHNASTCRLLF